MTETAQAVRVLVAEDNEDHLFLTVRALQDMEGLHLEVEAVRDGEEALDFIHRRGQFEGKQLPHLILLDIKMPRVGGLEVLAEIKKDPALRRIPVVVLSSSDRREDINATYQLGGNSYVTKPSGVTGLREGIRGLTGYWMALASLPAPPT